MCLQQILFLCFLDSFAFHLLTHRFHLQARNSYSNEVVAIKKMSYNGKQTTEVRLPHTEQHRHVNRCILDQEFTVKKKDDHNIREEFHALVDGVKCFETL